MIFPSEWYEIFGYAIIESFACGTPVIASRIGGLRELVENGVTGFLFEAGNPKDLLQRICDLMENKKLLLKMRHNARELAEERYSENVGYENLVDVYKMVMDISGKERNAR